MNTRMNNVCGYALAGLILVGLVGSDEKFSGGFQTAQQGVYSNDKRSPNQSPYSQTLSPYLDLLRNDNSALSPYHSFVRPRQQIQQNLNQQSVMLNQMKKTIRQTGIAAPTQQRLPTGRGGTFNNHLHYYNFNAVH